jgi:superfamily I DNA and/or RNA helicase
LKLSNNLSGLIAYEPRLSTAKPNRFIKLFPILIAVWYKLTDEPPFDYVIVDEASQALLAMFGAAKLLGKKNIWFGDTKLLTSYQKLITSIRLFYLQKLLMNWII